MNESEVEIVYLVLCRLQTKRLAILASVSRICGQQWLYAATKVSLFRANYDRELRMAADIQKKRKVEKVKEFAERIKKKQKEAETVLRKAQEEIK